ncbi:MAG: YbgC/FadM family acyl-CoA thioesterase [Rhizomicrobium sp.]
MTVESFGRFAGKVYVLPIRIYYEDTDLSGIVYHANYLRFMERGRTEFFRAAGIEKLAELDGPEPFAWTLRTAALEYKQPARLDDLIEVRSAITSLSGARMIASQDIYCGSRHLTHGTVEACIISLNGRPKRIPQETRDKLLPCLLQPGA